MPIQLIQIDTRRRVTLPPSAGVKPGEALSLEVLEDGRILLIPVEAVPRHQLWAWAPECRETVKAALEDPRPSRTIANKKEASAVAKRWERRES